jgi:23S rRNA pseudouridine1911/1915/1917 synthase
VQKAARPDDPRAKEAVTEYRVVEKFRGTSLVELRLVTGRRNQIRLQAHLRGHTLVGERRYVDTGAERAARAVAFPRQALHAYCLAFDHPLTGKRMRFEAPMPDDLAALLARLRV